MIVLGRLIFNVSSTSYCNDVFLSLILSLVLCSVSSPVLSSVSNKSAQSLTPLRVKLLIKSTIFSSI